MSSVVWSGYCYLRYAAERVALALGVDPVNVFMNACLAQDHITAQRLAQIIPEDRLNELCGSSISLFIGETPLLLACRLQDLKTVEILVDRGADISSDKGYITPLEMAINLNSIDIIQFFLTRGVNIRHKDGSETPLLRAFYTKNETIVKLLFQCMDFDSRNEELLYCIPSLISLSQRNSNHEWSDALIQLILSGFLDPFLCSVDSEKRQYSLILQKYHEDGSVIEVDVLALIEEQNRDELAQKISTKIQERKNNLARPGRLIPV